MQSCTCFPFRAVVPMTFDLSFLLDCLLLWRGRLDEVTADEELQKEKEVAAIHAKGCQIVAVRNGATVRPHVDEIEHSKGHPDEHLRYLQDSHCHGPGWSNLYGHEEVIEVHD